MRTCDGKTALTSSEVFVQLVELHKTKGCGKFGGLEVPTVLIEDEDVVVFKAVVEFAEEAIDLALE
jgi:hypothetical protein